MDDQQYSDDSAEIDTEAQARRAFLKKVSSATATAPAVALLMAANLKAAKAQVVYGGGSNTGGSGSS